MIMLHARIQLFIWVIYNQNDVNFLLNHFQFHFIPSAITLGVRILGPAAGFVLGSFCTRLYVNLDDPGFGPSDPKWVGAWWLGLVLISSMMVFTAIAMFSFPKQLRGYRIASSHQSKQVESEKIKDIEKKEVEEKPKLKGKHFN